MTSNSHQVTAVRHDVREQLQMAVVDVRTVKRNDIAQLGQQRTPCCFNTQRLQNFHNVVGPRARRVHGRVAHDSEEVDTFRVQQPLSLGSNTVGVHPLRILLTQENLDDARNAGEQQLVEQRVLRRLQEVLLVVRLVLAGRLVDQANANDQLVRILVRLKAVQQRAKLFVDAAHNVFQRQLLVSQRGTRHLKAQQPRRVRLKVCLHVRHGKVVTHKLLVLLDDGRLRVRIVPNLRLSHQLGQRRVLEFRLHRLGLLRIL
mmetsp:Transcript_5376/g.17339  ORF Transcript_5376/g.17339 Transcript_5376/m.17339 type:complete len:259 (-) Transcript_5376:3426-4202(-)